MTLAEVRLWTRLRRKQLGYRFRRQHPIGPFIVDFICLEQKLIVEADGRQHDRSLHDLERDAWLRSRGYRVIRYWNNDILAQTDEVLISVLSALKGGPAPGAH